MNTKLIAGIAVVAILAVLYLSGMFGGLFTIYTSYTTVKATGIAPSSLTFTVIKGDLINTKGFSSYTSGFATDVIMQGDSDLAATKEVCDAWGGIYSESTGCDVRYVPADAEMQTNSLIFTDGIRSAPIPFKYVQGGVIWIGLPSAEALGCTIDDFYNDACRARVTGSISFSIEPTTPAEYCGDGVCQASESYSTCPSDCDEPPPIPPPSPLQFIMDLWMGFVNWLKSIFGIWTIAGADNFMAGDTVSKDLTAMSSLAPDTDYSDGTVTYVYGKWAVVKDGTVIEEGDFEEISTQSYTHSFYGTYNQAGGYVYAVVVYSASSTFDVNTGMWSPYTIAEDKAEYAFNIVSPNPPPNPLGFLAELWNGFIGWLKSLFGL